MGKFLKAYKITMSHEGGYINDPLDAGGETYKGIARRYHPEWQGWSVIDACSDKRKIPHKLLQKSVYSFYKKKYWDVYRADYLNQKLANELFDTGVNMGTHRASKFLQMSLNYLNRDNLLFTNLIVDGKISTKTMLALDKIKKSDLDCLLKILNILQGKHYLSYIDKRSSQKRYVRGWMKRVKL